MTDILPKDVLDGLKMARKRKQRKNSRLRVRDGDKTFTIIRHWASGFAVDAEDGSQLRGLVDVFDGARHMSQCLIIAAEQEAGEMVYEFKRTTAANRSAPLDYERDESAPVALLSKPDT